MAGNVLRHFQLAAILQIGGDARGAEGVIADSRGNAGVARPALKHAPGIGLSHPMIG